MPRVFSFAAFLFLGGLVQATPAQGQEGSRASIDVEALVAKARDLRLHERREWQLLVHYRLKRSRWTSEADNAGFFVAPDGKTNPEAELMATLRGGFTNEKRSSGMPDVPDMTVRCQFPARWTWLMKELSQGADKFEDCGPLQDFRGKVNARSATLVFSSYYINNPSTVFGHLLLRLNKQEATGRTAGSELLDTGVNYAAITTTSNPLLYAFMGMAGFFRGTFTALPYYFKVREYSDAESRDLWEYELVLHPEEIERMVDHIWEMGSTYFDYYYFDENCAYHLLAVIEAAAPRLRLLDRMPFYVLPVDAVKAVTNEEGLVSRVHYRPSTARQLSARFELLSSQERSVFLRARNAEHPAKVVAEEEELSAESTARIFDAILDHIDHKYFRELVFKTDPQAAQRKQEVLLARARLPSGGEVSVEMNAEERPDRGHESSRWWLAGGARENAGRTEGAIDAEMRFALHGFLDSSEGYPPYAVVEFWRMQGRYLTESRDLRLQSFSLFTVSSLAPFSRLDMPFSWRVNVGAERIRDRRCDDCLAAQGEALGGLSFAPSRSVLIYSLVGPVAETSNGFRKEKWLLSSAARVGFRWRMIGGWQLGTEGEWRRVFDRESFDRLSGKALLRWNLRGGFAFEADYSVEAGNRDIFLRTIRYF